MTSTEKMLVHHPPILIVKVPWAGGLKVSITGRCMLLINVQSSAFSADHSFSGSRTFTTYLGLMAVIRWGFGKGLNLPMLAQAKS